MIGMWWVFGLTLPCQIRFLLLGWTNSAEFCSPKEIPWGMAWHMAPGSCFLIQGPASIVRSERRAAQEGCAKGAKGAKGAKSTPRVHSLKQLTRWWRLLAKFNPYFCLSANDKLKLFESFHQNKLNWHCDTALSWFGRKPFGLDGAGLSRQAVHVDAWLLGLSGELCCTGNSSMQICARSEALLVASCCILLHFVASCCILLHLLWLRFANVCISESGDFTHFLRIAHICSHIKANHFTHHDSQWELEALQLVAWLERASRFGPRPAQLPGRSWTYLARIDNRQSLTSQFTTNLQIRRVQKGSKWFKYKL